MTKQTKSKMGRPTAYTDAIVDEILRRHSNGETLTSICRAAHIPNISTVLRWVATMPEFARRYATARLMFADALFDEALTVADSNKAVLRTGSDVVDIQATKADVARDRLRVDTRLRIVAKINPEKYGDRLNLHHSGELRLDQMDDATLNARLTKQLHDLGVIELIRSWGVSDQQEAALIKCFHTPELPTAPIPPAEVRH